jgi:hypothetical protein
VKGILMNRHNSKSGLFLMEMIIVILFFSICAGICIRVFAAARITADHSSDLNNAVVRSTTVAEIYKAENGDIEQTVSILNDISDGDVLSASVSGTLSMSVKYDDMMLYLEKKENGLAEITAKSSAVSYSTKCDETGSAEIFSMNVRAGGAA